MVTPQLNSGASETWAPSGMAYMRGHLIFAGLRGQSLYVVDVSSGRAEDFKKYLSGVYGRLRTVTLGPDGMLYVITSNRDALGKPVTADDRIIRIDPKMLGI
jgi:glucose/arabinose dehydrogenase